MVYALTRTYSDGGSLTDSFTHPSAAPPVCFVRRLFLTTHTVLELPCEYSAHVKFKLKPASPGWLFAMSVWTWVGHSQGSSSTTTRHSSFT